MTMWERMEDLARRVRELEGRQHETEGRVSITYARVEALESKSVPAGMRVGPAAVLNGEPIGALEAIGDGSCEACGARPGDEHIGNCPKYIEAIQHGWLPPPPSYEARMLREAVVLLGRAAVYLRPRTAPEFDGGGIDQSDIHDFLARARVALEKP